MSIWSVSARWCGIVMGQSVDYNKNNFIDLVLKNIFTLFLGQLKPIFLGAKFIGKTKMQRSDVCGMVAGRALDMDFHGQYGHGQLFEHEHGRTWTFGR